MLREQVFCLFVLLRAWNPAKNMKIHETRHLMVLSDALRRVEDTKIPRHYRGRRNSFRVSSPKTIKAFGVLSFCRGGYLGIIVS